MADTTVYVDPGAGGAGDGTSYADAYLSLNSALVNEATDLTSGASQGIQTINCRGATADTTRATCAGYTTSATEYVQIQTETGEATGRHDGKYNTGTYRLEMTGIGEALSIEDAHTRIIGIQTRAISPNATDEDVGVRYEGEGATDTHYISKCILRGGNGNDHSGHGGVFCRSGNFSGTGSFLYIFNNIIYDFHRGNTSTTAGAGMWLNEAPVNFVVYNNTVDNCMINIKQQASNTCLAKNNLSTNSQVAANAYSGTFTSGSDYNVSDDTTSVGTGSNNVTSGSVTYVDAANDDYHLSGSSTDGKDDGTDLSADGTLAFDDDIDGDTRPATTWDAGADETVAGGAPVVLEHLRKRNNVLLRM